MRSKRSARSRAGVCLGFALVGAAISVVSSEIGQEGALAAEDSLGAVTMTPPDGAFSQPTVFTAEESCPATSKHYRITLVGGGAAAETNMTGTETFPEGVRLVDGIALGAGTFQEFAAAEGITLSGPGTVKIQCIKDIAGTVDGSFSSPVTFSGTGATTSYTSGGVGASPSPSTSPSTSPSPSPGASTTPTPSPEATATPDPDEATPTPDPDTDGDADTDTDGTGGGGENTPLPNTGAQDPKQIITIAVLFGLTGWLLTLFEGASRPREDWS